MKSILSGIVLMIIISVIAGYGLQAQFNTSASDSYTSANGSVRLDH